MNKPLSKNLQNTDRNTTLMIGVCVYIYITEVEIFGSVQKKNLILRKWPLKICIVIKIYRCKQIKCYERNA